MVRLVELPQDATTPTKYACLSHCWGKTRSKHMTKIENLAQNMSGIPIAELPKTFREAIQISRALDISHLWIDSLCIVQDDTADWASHVNIMFTIYKNADITLAAGASADGDRGFFSEPYEAGYMKLTADGHDHNVYFRERISHPDSRYDDERLPLMKRGW